MSSQALRPITRRSLVAAAPAAVVAASLPAVAASAHPDAALLALREPYERTLAAAEAVSPAHSRAETAALALRKAQPDRDQAEIEREIGLDVAKSRWEGALEMNDKIIGQIIETPALTLEGLIFKAEICERESMHADLAEAIVADLAAMGGLDA